MRLLLILALFITSSMANEALTFFNASKQNKVFCHTAQYSYKMVTHKNADVVVLDEHTFFRMKNENLYIPVTACRPEDGKTAEIVY